MGLVIAACLGQPRPQAQEGNQGVKSRLLRGQAAVGRAERPDAPGWSSLESGRRSMDCGLAVCGMSIAYCTLSCSSLALASGKSWSGRKGWGAGSLSSSKHPFHLSTEWLFSTRHLPHRLPTQSIPTTLRGEGDCISIAQKKTPN